MDRKRKQPGGGSAVPSTSKSSKSSAGTSGGGGGTGGGSRSAGHIAPGSASGQGFSGQLHPLLNPVVLSNLFGYCPPGLLATCRLVCKTWRNDSLPAWRSSATPQFAYKEKMGAKSIFVDAGERSSKSSATPLLEFLKFWERECSTLPFQNYHLAEWEFGMRKEAKRTTRGQSQAEALMELLASHAKKLILETCAFRGVEEFRRAIYQSFPKLQTLILVVDPRTWSSPHVEQPVNIEASLEPSHGEQTHLKSISVRFDGAPATIPISWLELLTQFPNLTSVHLSSSPFFSISDATIQSFFEAVSMIRERDPNKLPQLCLDANGGLDLSNAQLSQELFGRIRQLNVSLASVRINLLCNLDLIENLLTFHGKTLRRIEFIWDPDMDDGSSSRRTTTLDFPFGVQLNNLQELTICNVICQNMDYLKYTPNLRRLRIVNILAFGDDHMEPLETELVSGTTELGEMKLSTLKHLYFGYKLNPDDLSRFFNWFPKLEALTAFLDNELFASVCENWPGLKHLHILGKEMTDEGITGMGGTSQSHLEAGPIRPYLANLKGLECFQMESARPALKDVSAFRGFLELPKLRHLEVGPYCSMRFGWKAKRDLRKNIPDCQLDSFRFRDLDNEERDMCPDFEWNAKSFAI